jgi:DNA-binding transcriptional LysR family regulator
MDLDQLRTLVAAAEEGSLSRAALRRNLSQPAVSLQLKALEEETGVRLFHRSRRGVAPTGAGDLLLGHARRLLQVARLAGAELAEYRGLERGSLRLGATDAAATGILPDAFARYHGLYPGIEVAVEVAGTGELLDALRGGALDLVLGTLPVEDPALVSEGLFTERLRLMLPGAWARRSIPAILAELPFIAYPRASTTRRLVDAGLARAGWTVRPAMEIGRPRVMARLVEAGLGVSVLPDRVHEEAVRAGSIRPVSPRRFQVARELGLIRLAERELEPAARALAELLGGRRRATSPPPAVG